MDLPPTHHVLSFDIGIKNLAYCFFTTGAGGAPAAPPTIDDWRIVDLMAPAATAAPLPTCTCTVGKPTKKTPLDTLKICGKVAKYRHPASPGVYYCEVHAKHHATAGAAATPPRLFPKKAHERAKLTTLTRDALVALAATHGVTPPPAAKPPTKIQFIEALCEHFRQTSYVHLASETDAVDTPNARETDLITLGRSMVRLMDERAATWAHPPTHILLENQISTIASRMMTIQGELMMYFMVRFPDARIEFISSKHKLKGFVADRSPPTETLNASQKYKQHKQDAVVYTRQWMESHPPLKVWEPTLNESKKKDDLCDCFLQGMWYMGYRSVPTTGAGPEPRMP